MAPHDDFQDHIARARITVEEGAGGVRDTWLEVDGPPLAARSHLVSVGGLAFMLGENVASRDLVMRGEHDAPLVAVQTLLSGSSSLAIDGLDAAIGEPVGELVAYAAPTGRSTVRLRAQVKNQGFRIRFATAWMAGLAARHPPVEPMVTAALDGRPFLRARRGSPGLRAEVEAVMDSAHLGPARAIFLEGHALGWLAIALAAGPGRERLPRREVDRMHEARAILLARSVDPPTLRELAAAIGSNEFALKRNFKQVFGQPVHAFVLAHRIDTARRLLVDTDDSVERIAETIGYRHASHFCTAFRRAVGVSPGRYRTAARG